MRQYLSATMLVALCGCAKPPSIEVINTSAGAQYVFVLGERDYFWQDTLPTGKTHCWIVPAYARHQKVTLLVSDTAVANVLTSHDYSVGWSDTVRLDQPWQLHIHTPRFVRSTAEWQQRRAELQANADSQLTRGLAMAVAGKTPASIEQIMEGHDRMLNHGVRQPGAPYYQSQVDIAKGTGCRGEKGA